ncbi:hypothetical protein HU200_066519 [Digitaria exilis]|uniref:Acetyltransferase n=1 Tax=Digitaria exilis TaxID=1010633 RepID=A0A834ZY07_9POAL|nr:hypothetical protein HU200_066519 [Digitaria exilis]
MAPQIPADAVVEAASAVAAAAPAIAPPNGMGCKDALAPAITVVSKQTVRPSGASAAVGDLRLSVSDMPMLSCHYIQKGLFFPPPPPGVTMLTNSLFPMDRTVSYGGHARPLTSFQLTVLGDGAVFVGLVANHAVVDGTSFWHFFNTWAGLCRGAPDIREPDFRRDFFGDSTAVLRFPGGVGPAVTFDADAPLRERIVHFSARRDSRAEGDGQQRTEKNRSIARRLGDQRQGHARRQGDLVVPVAVRAHMEGGDARAPGRWLPTRRRRSAWPSTAGTVCVRRSLRSTSGMRSRACRRRRRWPTWRPTTWAGRRGKLHATVAAHGDGAIRRAAAEWEAAPRCFPLGNPDGAALTMGSSPRFPMYDGNDFGWGRALAVRSGRANKFDGKMSAFPGQAGDGSVDVEVCLAPDTMACLLRDEEFLQYVSTPPAP